ncbi:MAG: zinc ABC transporter substrate-binding protein, partial [Chloroflexi bacterium]|nr:zinc ABC transporter substrate-binding protein [Chloroflexota bacterium]
MARALILAPLLVLAAIVAACSRPVVSPGDPTTIRVVTTSTVFADLVRASSGERVSVTSLVPAGTDVHTYQAKPRDVQAVVAADLVVMNGLGL